MSLLSWDKPLERLFETGVDHGVLYPKPGAGVVWNGLTSVNETSRGGEVVGYYQDGVRRFQKANPTEFGATLSAFMYPDAFMPSDGIYTDGNGLMIDSQDRKEFGLSYRTRIGNNVRGADHAYKLHMIYNATAQPSARSYASLGNASTATPFSWELFTRPIVIDNLRASSHIMVDTSKAPADVVVPLEDILYGSPGSAPRLPLPSEIFELFTVAQNKTLTVSTDSDGQFTVSGSENTVKMLDLHTFQVDSPGVVFHDDGTYTVSDY